MDELEIDVNDETGMSFSLLRLLFVSCELTGVIEENEDEPMFGLLVSS